MSNGSPFPPRPRVGLNKDELINYLLEHQRRGYSVYQAPGTNGALEIALDDVGRIKFSGFSPGKVQLQGYYLNDIVQFFDCTSMLEVRRAVEAVFDPYLENRSLASLIDILSFGQGTVADGVRVLSTEKTITGNVPRLTKSGFDAWFNQLDIAGEIRIMAASQHRRFILLSGGQSLLLGQSLNSIHKNEAVRLEADVQDRAFFDRVWAQAAPLV